MNAPKYFKLRDALEQKVKDCIFMNSVFSQDLDDIEELCRQIETARKEPMPCKSCGHLPEVTNAFVFCHHCRVLSGTVEQWDKFQQ